MTVSTNVVTVSTNVVAVSTTSIVAVSTTSIVTVSTTSIVTVSAYENGFTVRWADKRVSRTRAQCEHECYKRRECKECAFHCF